MTASTPPDNTVLVLYPPSVNGQTTPVEGAHIGVPLVAYDLVTDGEGAVVLVDPPSSGTMDPGDVMELWLEGEQAALDSKTIVDPNARTTLRIPKGRLHPDRINMLYYTVRRGSSNLGTSTPPLEILYNRIRPGLKDRLTDPGGHSELKLLLPDEFKNGVGPDFVSAEVCVAYPYCRAYDLITLKCNGELLEPKPRVNPNQAPQPPNPGDEDPITICFTVTRAYLDKAKRQDKKLHFSYTVTDQLGNGPDTDAPWSPVQTVDEDLDGKRLPMAILLERMEDYPGDDAEEIDLEKLAGKPLLLVVLTIDQRFVAGYEVIATYTAKNTGQPADVVVTVSGKVEADPFGQKKPCILEVPNNKIFAGSNVIVTYELRKPNGDLVGSSRPATGTVTGSTPEDLLPPFLVAPAANPIDVLAYLNGVTVRIEHLQARDGDRARLVEINPPAGSPQFPLVAFNSNKRVNTVLSPAFLAARHGQDIEVRWNLNRYGGQAGKSKAMKFSVMEIANEDPRLPTPEVPQATDEGYLILYSFKDDAQVRVAPWTGMLAGQKADLKAYGFKDDDSAHTISLLSSHTVTDDDLINGLKADLLRNELIQLKHNSELTIAAKINFAPNGNFIKEVACPKRLLKFLKQKTASGSETWEQRAPQVFRQNTPVKLANGFTVHVIREKPNSPYYVQILHAPTGFPPSFGSKVLLADGTSLFRLELDGVAQKVKLEFSAVHVFGTELKFCNSNGETLHRVQIPVTANPHIYTSSYTAPIGKHIVYVEILVGPENDGGIWIDNIEYE
ncbi:hypothetical protein [Pseudomonas sp. UV AK001]|uniref:hypothetical protein n=1 Tax=Pseudomonas sp. UV AK001 TaxID=3384791 RepID=UPI0038D43CBF